MGRLPHCQCMMQTLPMRLTLRSLNAHPSFLLTAYIQHRMSVSFNGNAPVVRQIIHHSVRRSFKGCPPHHDIYHSVRPQTHLLEEQRTARNTSWRMYHSHPLVSPADRSSCSILFATSAFVGFSSSVARL